MRHRHFVARPSHTGDKILLLLTLAASATASGCGPADGHLDPESTVQAIINGAYTADAVNVALFAPGNATPSCSGTLVRNNVILTAAHCFQNNSSVCTFSNGCPPPNILPENMRVVQHGSLSTSYDVSIFGAVGKYQQDPSEDVVVMQLASPFTVNGSTLGFSVQLWGGVRSDLDKTVAAQALEQERGFGRFNCSTNDTQREHYPTPTGTSDGTYAKFMAYAPDNGKQMFSGDSGSSLRWMNSIFSSDEAAMIGPSWVSPTMLAIPASAPT